ncbi:MAG: hypothetical protein JWP91_1876 [Fibrobacteres bacterium]|nr:hypothetical protein [Fibrobacterota bacterium]
MKKLTVLTGLILAAWAGAKVCEQAYHLQDAYQYILLGNSAATLQVQGSGTKLDKGMNLATLLHDSTEYRMITDWDGKGSCDTWVKREVDFALRKKAEKKFSVENSMGYSVKINDGSFTFKKPGWDEYWFGFASKVNGDTVALYDAIGKFKNQSKLNLWYGNATMKRTIYSSTGASKGSFTHFYPELTSHPDSAALAAVLLNTWKDFANSDTQKVEFTVQLIKLTYDSIATPISGARESKARIGRNGFQANQTGNLVLIRPGDTKFSSGEPLSLYGMMGSKIATLHPTGYMYQWNGKTAGGADAPTGVYFVQSGNRILGKFFFTR